MRILVVDDDLEVCRILQRILAECGAEISTATSVAAAILQLHEKPHVLLGDISMPERDGFDLIRAVRNHRDDAIRGIPSIAVTALVRPEDRTRALEAGYNSVVAKPIDMNELLDAIFASWRTRH
jgi:CheY-like chemotaxis protein